MSFEDFLANFTTLEICHLSPESFSGKEDKQTMHNKEKKRWHIAIENNSWRKKVSAGGCKKFIDSFAINPQFHVTVIPAEGKNVGTLIVGLMQKDNRAERVKAGTTLESIGFMVFEVLH